MRRLRRATPVPASAREAMRQRAKTTAVVNSQASAIDDETKSVVKSGIGKDMLSTTHDQYL
jgi:glucosamine 6-phosphate synthetase-like amidotransferase/phosphosugar isomerase protein